MKQVTYDSLEETQKKALDAAAKAIERAYNPYSHFYVGAALYTEDGNIVTGSNFENAAYAAAICAERSAVVRANAMGMRVFAGIAVIARGDKDDTEDITSPCGICRQVLFEVSTIAGQDLTVILSATKKNKIIRTSIQELFPHGFGPENLHINVSKYRM